MERNIAKRTGPKGQGGGGGERNTESSAQGCFLVRKRVVSLVITQTERKTKGREELLCRVKTKQHKSTPGFTHSSIAT